MLARIIRTAARGLEAAAQALAHIAESLEKPHGPENTERPSSEEIVAACEAYAEAAEKAREADRTKRQAKKHLGGLKTGLYGPWRLVWKPSNRRTVDGEAVRRVFESHGLGDVPMKTPAPTLVLERA